MTVLHVDHYEYAGNSGSGAPLLLIHGWGMHGGMWSGVAEKLAQNFNVYAVDLPGHGFSAYLSHFPFSVADFTIDSVVDELSAQFVEPLSVCGWSLGGQIALRWAMRQPQQVERLVTVASTPSFVRREGWDHALSADILQEFADSLQHHYALTLKRFLALQVRGGEQEREWLTVLRDGLFSRGEPDLAALQSGLEILRGCDLRGALPEVRQATLVLAGERDTLIPHQATQYLADKIPGGRLVTIKGAAHAPFLSHPDIFVEQITDFIHGGIM
jgi:pimeloyl-[acyl-carrier protein] methyl ester esterase